MVDKNRLIDLYNTETLNFCNMVLSMPEKLLMDASDIAQVKGVREQFKIAIKVNKNILIELYATHIINNDPETYITNILNKNKEYIYDMLDRTECPPEYLPMLEVVRKKVRRFDDEAFDALYTKVAYLTRLTSEYILSV